jgi:hypothetical protein
MPSNEEQLNLAAQEIVSILGIHQKLFTVPVLHTYLTAHVTYEEVAILCGLLYQNGFIIVTKKGNICSRMVDLKKPVYAQAKDVTEQAVPVPSEPMVKTKAVETEAADGDQYYLSLRAESAERNASTFIGLAEEVLKLMEEEKRANDLPNLYGVKAKQMKRRIEDALKDVR